MVNYKYIKNGLYFDSFCKLSLNCGIISVITKLISTHAWIWIKFSFSTFSVQVLDVVEVLTLGSQRYYMLEKQTHLANLFVLSCRVRLW